MKNPILFLLAICVASVLSCTSEKPSDTTPLTGVWELVSGEWKMQDTTFVLPGPGMELKSMKYYSRDHFFCIGMGAPNMGSYAFSGVYKIDGDKYTESVTYSSGNNVGDEYLLSFQVKGDELKIQGDWFHETWKRIE